jgi:hypothetical protein
MWELWLQGMKSLYKSIIAIIAIIAYTYFGK